MFSFVLFCIICEDFSLYYLLNYFSVLSLAGGICSLVYGIDNVQRDDPVRPSFLSKHVYLIEIEIRVSWNLYTMLYFTEIGYNLRILKYDCNFFLSLQLLLFDFKKLS